MSRGFLCTLFGVLMTLFSWYGPWAWPAAPAFFVLETFFGGSYDELPFAGRAAVLVLLIIVNVAAWGVAAWLVTHALRRLLQRSPVLVLSIALCLAWPCGGAEQRPSDPAAVVRTFYESYPNELEGGLPRGEDLAWISQFVSQRLYDLFRSALAYQEEWGRRNPDRPPFYLKPPFADGVDFTGVPDVIGGFQVFEAEAQLPGIRHVPIHFWFDGDLPGWTARVVMKEERGRFVIDDVIFVPSEIGEETWCLSQSLEWRESESTPHAGMATRSSTRISNCGASMMFFFTAH